MSLETSHLSNTYEGKARVAVDEGAKAQISTSIEEARAQFSAAVESLMRTPHGEYTQTSAGSFIGQAGGTQNKTVFAALAQMVSEMTSAPAPARTTSRGQGRS